MKRTRTVAALITSGALVTIGLTAPAHAADNGRIAFVAQPGGVALMDASVGAPVSYLLHDPAGYPAFAPDGSRIAVVNTSGALTTFLPDGTGDVTVATGVSKDPVAPAWSPDSTRLAYFAESGTDLKTLVIRSANGGMQTGVTDLVGHLNGSISWSPNGSTLLYSAPDGIWWVPAEAMATPSKVDIPGDPNARDFGPSWAPDGTRFAFARDCYTCKDPSKSGVWTVGTDGSDPQQIVSDNVQSPPSWSPDGKMIAFTTIGGNNSLKVTPASGGGSTVLMTGKGFAAPSWGGKPTLPKPVDPLPPPPPPEPTPPAPPAAPKNIEQPQISGDPVYGKKLTVSMGTWTGNPTSYTYEWTRCRNARILKPRRDCKPIKDATKASYRIEQEDLGMRLKATVKAGNAVGWGYGVAKLTLVPKPPKGKQVAVTFRILIVPRNGTITVPVTMRGEAQILSVAVTVGDDAETVKALDNPKQKVNVPVELSREAVRRVFNRPVVKLTLTITVVSRVGGKIYGSEETVDTAAVARR